MADECEDLVHRQPLMTLSPEGISNNFVLKIIRIILLAFSTQRILTIIISITVVIIDYQ